MFQIPVQNLDGIRKARKKVKGILVDVGLQSCQELLQTLNRFDPGEKHFYNTSWNDVSHLEFVTRRTRYRTNPYCCSLCKFSSTFLSSFNNHLNHCHEKEKGQELVVSCPECAFASHSKIVGKHLRMFHSKKKMQNYNGWRMHRTRARGGTQRPVRGRARRCPSKKLAKVTSHETAGAPHASLTASAHLAAPAPPAAAPSAPGGGHSVGEPQREAEGTSAVGSGDLMSGQEGKWWRPYGKFARRGTQRSLYGHVQHSPSTEFIRVTGHETTGTEFIRVTGHETAGTEFVRVTGHETTGAPCVQPAASTHPDTPTPAASGPAGDDHALGEPQVEVEVVSTVGSGDLCQQTHGMCVRGNTQRPLLYRHVRRWPTTELTIVTSHETSGAPSAPLAAAAAHPDTPTPTPASASVGGRSLRVVRKPQRKAEGTLTVKSGDLASRIEDPNMSTAKKAKPNSGRAFQEAWTASFGMIERNGKAFCTLCTESVVCRTSSVRRHMDTNHKSVAALAENERKEFFEEILRKYYPQYIRCKNYISRANYLTAASFQIALCIAKHGKPLSNGDIIKTAMLSGNDWEFLHHLPNKDEILQRISEMPLSRNTVKDRIRRMASDVSQQLTADLQKAACYSMCLDESTDINNHARLGVILRYPVGDIMREELVKLVSLPERAQGVDIYKAVMEAFLSQDISPEKVVSVTSDGSPPVAAATSGFIQFFVKETKHQVLQFHCNIHQEALCARGSSKTFDSILKDVTKMVNYITSRALNFGQFQALLDEVQAQYNCFVMYSNIRWLSRGRVLETFVAFLDQIRLFMNEKGQEYPQLADVAWLTNLMFFTDFTLHFKVLNKQLQNVGRTAEKMFSDIKTFERNLQVFERDLESGQLNYFPNLKMHLENSATFAYSPRSHQEICKEFSSIVAAAKVNLSNRFLDFHKMETTLCFLTSPDKAKFEELDLSCLDWLDVGNLEMELLEFQENSIWKNKFCDLRETLGKIEGMTKDSTVSSENEILKAWNSLPDNFKSMKTLGIALLTLYGSSYACEQLFSALNYIKSDTRKRLTDDASAACVALKLTKYEPRLDKLSACIQQQKSH